jgi:hypothetical protein
MAVGDIGSFHMEDYRLLWKLYREWQASLFVAMFWRKFKSLSATLMSSSLNIVIITLLLISALFL